MLRHGLRSRCLSALPQPEAVYQAANSTTLTHDLWSLPAALVLLAFGRVGAGLLTVALAPLAAWAPVARVRSATRQRRSEIRSEALELVSGFRQTGAWL